MNARPILAATEPESNRFVVQSQTGVAGPGATDPGGPPSCCLKCGRRIVDDNWFARIKLEDRRVVFCRPRCLELFLDDRERARRQAA